MTGAFGQDNRFGGLAHRVRRNGCEGGCLSVADGNFTACSDASAYTTVICDVDHSGTDGDASDGCEADCLSASDGTCTTGPVASTYGSSR